jgi:hypothetical protein
MRSALAEQLRVEQRQRLSSLTPAERLALALALGDEGVRTFAAARRVSADQARRLIQQRRQADRRPSACMRERAE